MIGTTVQVPLPEMGESVTEGSIVEWRRREGEWVERGETLVEVTTEKVDVEVPAPASGVVRKLLVKEGETVAVGAPLAEIDTTAERPAGEPKAAPAPAPPQPEAKATERPSRADGALSSGVASAQARRVAERHNVEISSIRGSGPDGLVLREDVEAAIENGTAKSTASRAASEPSLPPLAKDAKTTALRGPVAMLASVMEQSLSIPTATSFRTIGVGTLDARRRRAQRARSAAGRPEKSFVHASDRVRARASRARRSGDDGEFPARDVDADARRRSDQSRSRRRRDSAKTVRAS